VLEDVPAGIRAGKGAGARVIALRTTVGDSELSDAGADWILNDCSEIKLDAIAGSERLLNLSIKS
jgi:beta-phosphoglucomutase-like phosphatase (HAD superfamily)